MTNTFGSGTPPNRGNASVINVHTGKVTDTVKVQSGKSPQGVDVNPVTGLVYVANQVDNTVSVISP